MIPIEEEEEDTATPVFNKTYVVRRLLQLKDQELFQDLAVNSEGELIHFALIAKVEPVEFDKIETEEKWLKAMTEEINFIKKNQTSELEDPPSNKKPIALKWVFKIKGNPRGEVVKNKARLVTKEIWNRLWKSLCPVVRIETIKLVVAIATSAS
ncbi:hypothetical protein CR513_41314, partial [Mucuna pruriens]